MSDSVAAALGTMKPEPPTRVAVDPDEQRKVAETRPHPETPVPSLMKRSNANFSANRFWFRHSSLIGITVPLVRVSISMKLSQPSKSQRLLKSSERRP